MFYFLDLFLWNHEFFDLVMEFLTKQNNCLQTTFIVCQLFKKIFYNWTNSLQPFLMDTGHTMFTHCKVFLYCQARPQVNIQMAWQLISIDNLAIILILSDSFKLLGAVYKSRHPFQGFSIMNGLCDYKIHNIKGRCKLTYSVSFWPIMSITGAQDLWAQNQYIMSVPGPKTFCQFLVLKLIFNIFWTLKLTECVSFWA